MVATKRKPKEAAPPDVGAPKRRRVRVRAGQIVAVPLQDGTFALAHVASRDYLLITCVLFNHRRPTVRDLADNIDGVLRQQPIAVMQVTSDEIYDGLWPVIGDREPTYPVAMLDTGGWSSTASLLRFLFEAYYGLRPWDEMADPRHWEKALLPGVPVPPTIRYKRDFAEDPAPAATAARAVPADQTEAPVTDGPAEIHIEIKYPGDALPSVDLLRRRQALERTLEASGAGEVTDAGGGAGVMDIYLRTEDARRAIPLVEAAVQACGFAADARINASPPEGAPRKSRAEDTP